MKEPKPVRDALEDLDQSKAMEEEIKPIEKNKTWTLVTRLEDKNVIDIKWISKNKLGENGEVTRNKEILVCKGYAKEEGIDYGEKFYPVARLEGVRAILSYSEYKSFKIYQMDVKFTFLNDVLEKEVCIELSKGFFDVNNKNMVCRLHKVLYGLKQAPRAWYERLHNLLSKIFVDDIIFGYQDALCKAFTNEMKQEVETSMFGEIKFLVGLQACQMKYGRYITQLKYVK